MIDALENGQVKRQARLGQLQDQIWQICLPVNPMMVGTNSSVWQPEAKKRAVESADALHSSV